MSESSSSTDSTEDEEIADNRQLPIANSTQQSTFKDMIIKAGNATINSLQQQLQTVWFENQSMRRIIQTLLILYNELKQFTNSIGYNQFLSFVDYHGDVGDVEDQLVSLQDQLAATQTERDNALAAYDHMEYVAETWQEESERLETQIETMRDEHTDEVDNLNDRIHDLQEEVEDLSIRIIDLNADRYDQEDEMEDQQEYINDLEHQVRVLNPPNAQDSHHPEESGE